MNPIPQHDYAALSLLTQAADAMNPISNHPSQGSSGYSQSQSTPDYNSESSALPVLSARTMETMSAFGGAGFGYGNGAGNGNGRGYFHQNHASLGAYGNGNGMQILDAESYDDGRGAVRAWMEGEERARAQKEVVMSFGITDVPRLGGEKRKVGDGDVDVVDGGGKKRRKVKHKIAVVEVTPEEGEDEDEGGKKVRGRPRVDTKDETPAERRRTQIRLAQRAYRNRKETTISSLEKKVHDLRETNEEMSNIFINLYDFVVSQGTLSRDPELAHQFQNATERFLSLAKSAGNDDSNLEENGSEKVQKQGSAEIDSDRKTKGRKKASMSVPAQVISAPVSEPACHPWGGYTVVKEDSSVQDLVRPIDRSNIHVISRPTEDNASFPSEFISSHTTSQHADQNNFQTISKPTEENASYAFDPTGLQQYRSEISIPDNFSQMYMPNSFLPAPTSFAFSEISFARRIHRSTTEAALKLASMRNPSMEKYQRAFGIASMFESNDDIIARLKRVLARSSKETLQDWNQPFLHLGGSGTFYPMPESERNASSMPKIHSGYSMGPFSPAVYQVQELVDDDMTINIPAFKSDFFDSNDVEGYLRSRGIEIPPAADFVKVEIDLSSFGDVASRRSSSTPGSHSPKTPLNFVDGMLLHTNSTSDPASAEFGKFAQSKPTYDYDHATWNFNAHASHNTTNSRSNLEFDSMSGYGPSPGSQSSHPTKSVVTINVKKFVEELISRCICLGRAPGYRPNDVNTALMAAVKAGAHFGS